MKNTLLILLFGALVTSCSSSESPEPKTQLNIEGKWYVDFIFNYRTPIGKSPINASINTFPNENFIIFEPNGKASTLDLGIDTYGFDIFVPETYTEASYQIDDKDLKINHTYNGKKYVSYYTIRSVDDKKLVLFQKKAQFIKALEENRSALGETIYKEKLEIYNNNNRFESEAEFLK